MSAHELHRNATMLLFLTMLTLLHIGLVSSSDVVAATPAVAIVHAESSPAAALEPSDDSSLFDLDRAESKDPGGHAPKLEIIKQIRRLNSDGSYTVGYEADDGTFKIESRDVLGNVKGTYGYVDVNGEIKRVSYTAGTNATTSTTSRVSAVKSGEDSPAPVARNRTAASAASSSTTRRPAALAYLTTSAQTSPTRATVIQAIPKKTARLLPSASSSERPTFNHHQHHHYASTPRHSNDLVSPSPSTTRNKAAGGEPTTTVVYATSVPTNRPLPPSAGLINIRPTPLPGTYKTVEQLMRPDKLEITDHVSKVQISHNRDTSTAKPVTELVDEKLPSPSSASDPGDEKRTTRGSFVTRPTQQLDGHDEAVEAQQQVIYSQSAGDDSSHVYGSANPPGTSRPVFAATPTTRIPSAVLAARSRAAQLQNAINQQQLAKQQQLQLQQQQQHNDKVYAKPPRRRPEAREDVTSAGDQTAGEPSSENQYVSAQRPATVQIIAPPSASRELTDDQEKRVYRRPVAFAQNVPQAYRSREFVRQAPAPSPDYADYAAGPRQFRIPIPQAYPQQQQYQQQKQQPVIARPVYAEQQQVDDAISADPQQYLRETTLMSARPAAAASTNEAEYPGYRPRDRGGRQYLPYQPVPAANSRAIAEDYDPYAPPPHSLHHAQHHNPYSPYHSRAPLPSQLFQHPDRPLTARDFERLLNLLVIRHQQLQRYQPGYNPYHQPGPYHHQPQAPPYGYQQQIPRPPVYNPYDPRLSGLIRPPLYGEFSDQDAAFQTPTSPSAGQERQQQARPTAKRPIYYASERPEYSEASQPIGVQQQQQQLQEPEYLPADIREELLYRMLLLAMQPSQSGDSGSSEGGARAALEQSEASSPEYASLGTTTTTKPAALSAKFRKPVRSVQILGEE